MDSNREYGFREKVFIDFLEDVESTFHGKKKIFISNVNQKESGRWRN